MNNLEQRTKTFSLAVIRLFGSLPRNSLPAEIIGKQVLRSATSVGAQYREAMRGRSKEEFAAKLGSSLQELHETVYWFELLAEASIITKEKISPVYKEALELTAMITASLKTIKARKT